MAVSLISRRPSSSCRSLGRVPDEYRRLVIYPMLDIRRDEPEEWTMVRQSIRSLLARMAPRESVRQWDEERHYPEELFQALADQGYYAVPCSPELGGSGAGPEEMAVVGEELGRLGMDIAAGFGVTTYLGLTVQSYGTPEQQQRYLLPMITGRSEE